MLMALFASRALKDSNVRKALLVGCSLQLFQQLIGINTVSCLFVCDKHDNLSFCLCLCWQSFVYRWSTTLPGFSWCLASRATWQWSSGYLPSSPQSTFLPLSWVALAIFSIRKVKTFSSPGMALIDRLGRRVLCLCSYLGILGALLVIGAGFQLSEFVNSWVWVANF